MLSCPPSPRQFDYLERDSRYCGVRIACDFNRLMQFSKARLRCSPLFPCGALPRWHTAGQHRRRRPGGPACASAPPLRPLRTTRPSLSTLPCPAPQVIGDEICYRYSEYMNLHELFHSRAALHRQASTGGRVVRRQRRGGAPRQSLAWRGRLGGL